MYAIIPPPRTSWAKAGPTSGSIADGAESMQRIIARRLAQIIPLVLGVIVLNFTLIQLAPGSLFDVMTADQQVTNPEMLEKLPHLYDVDQPTYIQLLKYIGSVTPLIFGFSYRRNAPFHTALIHHL